MNQFNENEDPVWELLEHSSQTTPSDFFSRNVSREVRKKIQEESVRTRFYRFLTSKTTVASAGFGLVAIGVFFLTNLSDPHYSTAAVEAQKSTREDVAVTLSQIEYRSQLMAVADPGRLSDDSLIDLFF